MALVNVSKLIMPAGDENGNLKYLIGIKIGDKYPMPLSSQGSMIVFDTREEAQAYLDNEDIF